MKEVDELEQQVGLVTDFDTLRKLYDNVSLLDDGSDPEYKEIVNKLRGLSKANTLKFESEEKAGEELLYNNDVLRRQINDYLKANQNNKNEKYLCLVKVYVELSKINEIDENRYDMIYNPIDFLVAKTANNIKKTAKIKIPQPDIASLQDDNIPENEKAILLRNMQREYKNKINDKNNSIEADLERYIFLLELDREFKYADSKEFKDSHPDESKEWREEIIAIINSDNDGLDRMAHEFCENNPFAKKVKNALRDKKTKIDPATNNKVPVEENDLFDMYEGLAENGSIKNKVINAIQDVDKRTYPGSIYDVWPRAMKINAIDTPPTHKARVQFFEKDFASFTMKEAENLDMNFALISNNKHDKMLNNAKKRAGIVNNDQNINDQNINNQNNIPEDEEERAELDLSLFEEDNNVNNNINNEIKETKLDKMMRKASEQGDNIVNSFDVDIQKLEDCKKGVFFGSKEYDDILRELKEVNRLQNEMELNKINANKGLVRFDNSEQYCALINRKKNLLLDMKHYVHRKMDEKNNNLEERTNSRKRRLAMTEVHNNLLMNIKKSEKDFEIVNDRMPNRAFGAIIHELEFGNKVNQDSKRYNKILTDIKGLDQLVRTQKGYNKKDVVTKLNSEWSIFNAMEKYVLDKYGEVRDKKSEVTQKVNGEKQMITLGYKFRFAGEPGKKPMEPFSITEKRIKLMIENMERMGDKILNDMKGAVSKGFVSEEKYNQLKTEMVNKNRLFRIHIGEEKVANIQNNKQNNIINENIINNNNKKKNNLNIIG